MKVPGKVLKVGGKVPSFREIVISISRNGHLKSCARFIIERSEIRKKQHDFKCVHFECRMVLFYTIWEKSRLLSTFFPQSVEIVISISRNGLLKACARFIIERSEIRKKQHAFKSVHFECRMVIFYTIWEKSRLQSTSFPQSVENKKLYF